MVKSWGSIAESSLVEKSDMQTVVTTPTVLRASSILQKDLTWVPRFSTFGLSKPKLDF